MRWLVLRDEGHALPAKKDLWLPSSMGFVARSHFWNRAVAERRGSTTSGASTGTRG